MTVAQVVGCKPDFGSRKEIWQMFSFSNSLFFFLEIPPIGFIFAFVAPGQRQMCQRKRAKSNQKHLPVEPQVEEQASLLFLVGVTIQTVVMDPVWE